MDKTPDRLRALFFEVVDNQIRDGNPPATRQTYERLQQAGHSPSEAKRLISCIVAAEMFEISKHKQPFNEVRFIQRLEQLPEMPWNDDDTV
jgi:hypothetical protein